MQPSFLRGMRQDIHKKEYKKRNRINSFFKRAGDGNRTHVSSLEGWCSTIELHPHVVGVTGFEPATSWSQTRRSSQAEPHPEGFVCVLSVTQELVYSKGKNMSTTFFIFFYIFLKWLPDSLKELPGRHFIRIRCAIQRLYSRSPSQASLSWREEPCLDGLWHSSAGE